MRFSGAKMAPYSVTADDALWLARAVEAEGPIEAQVGATLVNGFCWARSRGYKGTLTTWVRAYAQPINPRWYESGDLFLASQKDRSAEEQRAAVAVARRREHVHSAALTFGAETRAAVLEALNGRVQLPTGCTDYAAANVDASRKGYTPLAPPTPGRNRLWSRPGAETWAGYLVDATDAWPWLVSIALVGFVVWKWGAHG